MLSHWMTRWVFFTFGCLEQELGIIGESASLAPVTSGAHADLGYHMNIYTSGCGMWKIQVHSLAPASQKAFPMAGRTPGCPLE